jgi:hypothetical protein
VTLDSLKFIDAGEVGHLASDVITYDSATLIDDLRRNGAQIPAAMIDE